MFVFEEHIREKTLISFVEQILYSLCLTIELNVSLRVWKMSWNFSTMLKLSLFWALSEWSARAFVAAVANIQYHRRWFEMRKVQAGVIYRGSLSVFGK